MARRNMHFNVRPRYTPGSPAAVDEYTALRVVEQERRAYEHSLTGAYGEEDLKVANTQGLKGIVEACFERSNGWDVKDLLTGEEFRRERIRADKLKPRMKVVRYEQGPYLPHGRRVVEVAQAISSKYNVTLFFGTAEDAAALAERKKALYELPQDTVSKYEEIEVEVPLPEGKHVPYDTQTGSIPGLGA
jgi:hypothetical protein